MNGRVISETDVTSAYVQRDLTSMKELNRYEGGTVSRFLAAISPDGRLLALLRGHTVHLYDTATDREICSLPGWKVYPITFSPDSRQLAGGGAGRLLLQNFPLKEWSEAAKTVGRDQLWTDLVGNDMKAVYAALTRLTGTSAATMAELDRLIQPRKTATDPSQIREWIADLDANSFRTRAAAEAKLVVVLVEAEAPLRGKLAARDTSPESRTRIESILSQLRPIGPLTGNELRETRYLQLLEGIHSKEARVLVERIAKGASGHLFTEEAKRIVARWLAGE